MIGLAVALDVLGAYAVTKGKLEVGWVAYAPLSGATNAPAFGLPTWARLLVWLGLIILWVAASAWLLRSQPVDRGR